MKNLTPLRFPGNKRWLVNYVENFITYHKLDRSIAEPYGGSASISISLLEMGIVNKAYINDKDFMIYAFWYSVFNLNQEFIEKIEEMSTNITIEKYYEFKKFYKIFMNSKVKYGDKDMLKYASTFLFLNRTSYSGIIKGGPLGGRNQESKYKIYCRFRDSNIVNKIKYLYKFKKQVVLSNLDGLRFIKNFSNKHSNSLLYIDPPYFKAGKDLYSFYFNREDHKKLATLLSNKIISPWLVSYDNNEFIKNLYSNKGVFNDKVLSNQNIYLPKQYLISSHKRVVYEILFSNKKIPPL
ncbi:site-specific DNA methylase [Candidatus Mancarchaeum acidiphilum]|uniref:site-specific DNA-methyltransferase (adenine-specific) n=1 Tax=Candidatus Mancarchaeum acidiphilum TaxID=1920749 RepID=A0A218NMP7_9ARCH|nr:DNA adenine methylase [Candidatus Mancarchaeum acidiphilum]ASI13760.1 site-specific DNA methylase [Candidatus Mancarchaeum acidiphilum]